MKANKEGDLDEACTDICFIEGDQNAPVTRAEQNRTIKLISRVHLIPIRRALEAAEEDRQEMRAALKSLDDAINNPRYGLESIRWWICRAAWGAAALGAGLMAAAKFLKDMGWYF